MYTLNNKQITDLLKNNNYEVIKFLFDIHYNNLCRYANKIIENKEIAEEIAQETFIYLWEKRNTININSSLKNYLFRAVRNQSLNYLKSKYARLEFQELEDEQTIPPDTESKIHYQELSEIVNNAIKKLPARCAIIFKLSRNFKMSHKEIAENLNISTKTVEGQITISLKRIRQYLDRYLQ